MKVAIIGGGAAGFFSAITAKTTHPKAEVVIFEKTRKVLTKVKISGGGRCNVTNNCPSIAELAKAYPRGGKQLKKAFSSFHTLHIMEWFESRGVPLITEEDRRVFPKTNRSQTIIDTLVQETQKLGIEIRTGTGIRSITPMENGFDLELPGKFPPESFDKVIIASGGSPKRSGLKWLEELGHTIEDPVPSLFTFNMPTESIPQLKGISVENALVRVQGTKLISEGPLLITHWGMSGPAILKLSAFGARVLNEKGYEFKVQVNWSGEKNHEVIREKLLNIIQEHPQKILSNIKPCSLPERLWLFLIEKAGLDPDKKWNELGKHGINKLMNLLTDDEYQVSGKTTFKEEFVTCGGIKLKEIDFSTMQSKVLPGLYFAGEVLDIDAITGGYNFQAAWTTGYLAGHLN